MKLPAHSKDLKKRVSKMARKSNDEVDQIVTGGTITRENQAFSRMIRDMAALATAENEEESVSSNREALAAIYNANTDDDVWDADSVGPINAQVLGGCELDIYDLQVKYSRGREDGEKIKTPWVSADGKQMYAIVTATRISKAGEKKLFRLPEVGETFQFNTSAQFLFAKLFTFYVRGKFGAGTGNVLRAAIQATDLGGGQAVLKLVRIPDRVMSGQTVMGTSTEPVDLSVADTEPPF